MSSWDDGAAWSAPLASGETPDLVGRDGELGRIATVLDAARAGVTSALVLEGEPGIGKTTLLLAASARADGCLTLWAHGVESDVQLSHGCLLELLTPLRAHLAEVPPAQAAALESALGWGAGRSSGDRYLVAAATLALLAVAAEEQPVLVCVDDLQWVDRESADAVLFALHRLHRDRVAFLIATRPGAPARPGRSATAMRLQGLTASQAAQILPSGLAAPVAARLIAESHGNPLALRELPRALSAKQRLGLAALPDQLALGPELEQLYDPVLAGLSPPAWRAVVLAAAAREGNAAAVLAALGMADQDAQAALDEAEERGVVVRDRDHLRFRHPLLRSATWHRATARERREAHGALAATTSADQATSRAWHLAHATTGTDLALAGQLVAVAGEARRRGGYLAAASALERAAALSGDGRAAAEHLAAAAGDAYLGGDLNLARDLASRVLRDRAGPDARGAALLTLGQVEQYGGSLPAAAELLDAAADTTVGRSRAQALAELTATQHRLGDYPGIVRSGERIAEHAGSDDPEQRAMAWLVVGAAAMVNGDVDTGRHVLADMLALLERDPRLRDDPRFLVYAMFGGALAGGDLRSHLPALERRLRVARERGALGVLVTALAMTAHVRAEVMGDHAGALADAGEAVDLAVHLGYVVDAAPAYGQLAWQYAARGAHAEAREALDRAGVLVSRAGTAEVAAHLALTAAFCALCRGDLDEVVRILEPRIALDGGVGALGEPLGVAPLLVEGYAGLGRTADAAELAQRYADASPSPLPDTAALIARCRALSHRDDAAAAAAYEEALAAHALAPARFETAHTRLLYGARLRRARRRSDARAQLRQARDDFAAMDLSSWAERAATELAATGETARSRAPVLVEPLTAQETRVALLAAQGLPNREIAGALFLSPKTIEHHLSSIYRKRGLRSRAQLAATFGAARAAQGTA